MSKIVYIGVDGGGTKTAVIAADEMLNIICEGEGAGINYNVIGVKKAADNLAEIICKLPLPEDYVIGGIGIGDPSIDDLAEYPGTREFLECVSITLGLNQSCLCCKSDVFMALYGATKGNPGAILISGTGSMGMAMDENGGIHVSGGWGRLTEDEGSGYYIAVNGLKAAFRYYDGAGPQTILLDKFNQYFGIDNPRAFIARYYAEPDAFPEIAGFSRIVGEAAKYDAEADKILVSCAKDLVDCMRSLLKKADLSYGTIGIYGSVFVNNERIRTLFEAAVKEEYPKMEIVIPSVRPQEAALEYVRQEIEKMNHHCL